MTTLIKYLNFSELNETQLAQYRSAHQSAFPAIILNSSIMKNYWAKIEEYFPHAQLFIINHEENLIGFMNTIPLFWNQPLNELPNEGWDWLVKKGVTDFENNIIPNSIGGLQIIVTKENQGKGFSKLLITGAKKIVEKLGYQNFIIPIRPTFKHNHPEMKMIDYISLKKDDKIYDPWIRTHLNSGAKIISVCENSMNVTGDLKFWEKLLNQKINTSGMYKVKGALNQVCIEVEKNHGEYREDNIWISYN